MSGEYLINSMTLKVEKENAKAMIEGFYKGTTRHYVTIFVAHENAWSMKGKFRQYPKLLTTIQQINPKHKLSEIGKSMRAGSYSIDYKYIAILKKIYHVKNNVNLWKEICNNGLFDIWDWSAPYNNLRDDDDTDIDKGDPRILLLRICEIDYDFENGLQIGDRSDAIPQRKVNTIRKIIPDDEYGATIEMLESSVTPYLQAIEAVND